MSSDIEYYNDRIIDKTSAITRTTVPFLEERLGWQMPVLDKGFIRVIDYMGDDNAIDEAARLSYGAGTRKRNETSGLINYLTEHHHTSPFEMCEIKLHVKLPIMVMRQWVRHRMASLNEYSARYSVLSNEFYFPQLDDIGYQSETNKQGRSLNIHDKAIDIRQMIQGHSDDSYGKYSWLIGDDMDVTRELARMLLPVNIYTEMYWKIDLHNLFHFLQLRADSHAQKEIRVYAELIEWLVMGWLPLAWDAYRVYRKDAMSFSAHEVLMIRAALVHPEPLDPKAKPMWASSLTQRQWEAFIPKIAMLT